MSAQTYSSKALVRRIVDEIYIFRVSGGRLAGAVAVEDNLARLQQRGLAP